MPFPIKAFLVGSVNQAGQQLVGDLLRSGLDASLVNPEQALRHGAAVQLGTMLGGSVGGQLAGFLVPPPRQRQRQAPPLPTQSQPAFFGGQCPDVQYDVILSLTGPQFTGQKTERVTGPISAVIPAEGQGWVSLQTNNNWNYTVLILGPGGETIKSSGFATTIRFRSGQGIPQGYSFTFQIVRVDGQPDNCDPVPRVSNTNNYYFGDTINNFPALPGNDNGFNFNPRFGPIELPSPNLDFSPEVELPDLPEVPDILGGIGDILDGIGTILDAVNGDNNGGNSNCLWNNGRIDLILEFLNNILTILRNWEEDGVPNGNPNLIPVTLNLDYVTEDENGERQLDNVQLTVIEPPNNLAGLFNQSAEIALTDRRKIRKILAILGGNSWDFNNDSDTVTLNVNPESIIRELSDLSYTIESDGDGKVTRLESKEFDAANLFELICSYQAVNYIRGGLWKYPSEVDETIVDRKAGPPGIEIAQKVKLFDQQDYNVWIAQQFEEIMGRWDAELEIEDADLLQEGNQSQTIILHSLSDALTEILSQGIVSNVYLKALLNMNSKNLIETVESKKESIANQYMIDSIIDYLGIAYKEEKLKIHNLCTVPKPNQSGNFGISELLESESPEIKIYRYSGKETLQVTLTSLLNAAAIIRGAFTRKLPRNAIDFINQIKEELGLGNKTIEQFNDEFDEFINDVEDGFNDIRPNNNNPYNREFEQRPRIIRPNQNPNGEQ